MQVVECPTCRGMGSAITGYNNNGQPRRGGPCGRCRRSGFVPVLNGQPSYPFGKDKDNPELVAHAAANPTTKPVEAVRTQGGLL